MRTALVVVALVAVAIAVAAAVGHARHASTVAALRHQLLATAAPTAPGAVDWASLPPPVARYLQWALGRRVPLPPPPLAVELQQEGELRTDERGGRWLRFHAVHLASPAHCGFVWNAKVAFAPLLHMRVVDSFAGGHGTGRVLLQSALPVGHAAAEPELDAGALHRFLAEAVWYPWALLPGEHLRWQPIDGQRAQATLTCGAVSVVLEFRFGPGGEVAAIHTPARWGRFGGRYEQLPWEGRFGTYAERGGVRVPLEGEVGWHRDGRLQPVWRGRLLGYRLIEAQ